MEVIAIIVSICGLAVSIYSVVYATTGGSPVVEVVALENPDGVVELYLRIQNPSKRLLYLDQVRIMNSASMGMEIESARESMQGSVKKGLYDYHTVDKSRGYRTVLTAIPPNDLVDLKLHFAEDPHGFALELHWSRSHPWFVWVLLPKTAGITDDQVEARLATADSLPNSQY